MKDYDFIFSLGYCCGVSQALRAAGLQHASYPLDWLGMHDAGCSTDVVCADFDRWMEAEDLRLVDVCHGAGFGTRLYLNTRTNIGYCHEFPDTMPFSESYPKVKETYDRRIERFIAKMREAGRILAVYLDIPSRPKPSPEEVRSIRARLSAHCPGARVDVLWFFQDDAATSPHVVFEEQGVTVVGADYKVVENGRTMQYIRVEVVAPFLKAGFRLCDSQAADERAKYAANMKEIHSLRWGPDKSRFRRWLNQRAYKFYRSLEGYLQKRGLIHPERPVWFWEDV